MLTPSPLTTPTSEALLKSTVALAFPSYVLLFATAPVIVRFFAVMLAVNPLGCDTV